MEFHHYIAILENISYMLLMLAFVMRNILYLRILTIISSLCAIIYYSVYTDSVLWINVNWEILSCVINLTQIAIIIHERREINFDVEEEKMLYQKIFNKLTPIQFKKLLKIGSFESVPEGTLLAKQGEPIEHIILITSGIASVKVDEKIVAYCKPANLVGEMSFITGGPASASVESLEPMRYIKWEKEALKAFIESDAEIQHTIQTIFSTDLIKKLTSSSQDTAVF